MNQSQNVSSPTLDEVDEYSEHPEETRNTLWENPTDRDVVMDLHVGTMPLYGSGPRPTLHPSGATREQRLGVKQFVVKAGKTREIPSEFDVGVQHRECMSPECTSKKLYCANKSHPSNIVGGLGPQLINRGMKVRPRLHPALDTAHQELSEMQDRAKMALERETAAKNELDIAKGQLILASQKAEAQSKAMADREAAILAKERELGIAAAAKKQPAPKE
jgi:hypothetical protein